MALSHLPTVTLHDRLVARCDRFGVAILASFAANPNPYSRDGIECDFEKQARAKMGECAACLYFGADPELALNWTARPDDGHDLIARGQRIDVKTIKHEYRYLIWPRAKQTIFDRKRFDVFLMVKENLPRFAICGWISKAEFFARKQVAPPGHRLQSGSWYVDQSELAPIENLARELNTRKTMEQNYVEGAAAISKQGWPGAAV
jgi:hypothetical protein